jgi:hypothetical protein
MMSLHVLATNCLTKVSVTHRHTDAYKTVRVEGVKGNLTTKLSQLRCGINEALRHIKDSLLGDRLRKNNSL